MSCDIGEVTESLENELYVTAHFQTLLSLLLPHRIFTYITWRAAHGASHCKKFKFQQCNEMTAGLLQTTGIHDMLQDCDVVWCYHVITGMISKMDSDVSFHQSAVIEFLVKEEK